MKTNNEDKDLDLLQDEIATITRSAYSRKQGVKHIKVRSSVEVARDTYKTAKRAHRARIKQLRSQIKSHKLLIKQARTAYKLVRLADKK